MSGKRGIAAAQPVGEGRNDLTKVRVINQVISQSVKGRVCTRDELINAASETLMSQNYIKFVDITLLFKHKN